MAIKVKNDDFLEMNNNIKTIELPEDFEIVIPTSETEEKEKNES